MDTSELIELLAKEGVKVKSPIAGVDTKIIDKLKIASERAKKKVSPESKPVLTVVETAKNPPNTKKDGATKKDKDGDVIPLKRTVTPKKKNNNMPETVAPDKTSAPKTAKKTEEKAGEENKTVPGGGSAVSAVFSYIGAGLAAIALLFAIVLAQSVSQNDNRITEVASLSAGLKGELALVSAASEATRNIAIENQQAVSAVNKNLQSLEKDIVKSGIERESASLSKLANNLPTEKAKRLKAFADKLADLAGAL